MRRNTEFLLVGIVAGATLGFLAGLLLAPASGVATRRRIALEAARAADAARLLAERAEHAAGLLGDRVGHALGKDEETAWKRVQEIRESIQGYTQTQANIQG